MGSQVGIICNGKLRTHGICQRGLIAMNRRSIILALTLLGAIALAVLAGAQPSGLFSPEDVASAEAGSGDFQLTNYAEDVTPQTDVDRLEATKSYVDAAIRRYREDSEAAKAYYQSEDSFDAELGLYLLLLKDGVIVQHPVTPSLQGSSISQRADPLEREYGKALAGANEDGVVVEYLVTDPSDNFTFRNRTVWARRADGLVFSAGWIDGETDVESALTPRQRAIGTVIEARDRVLGMGILPAAAYYRTPESIDGEYYVIMAMPAGNIVADATRPDLPEGTNLRDMEASDDPELGQTILALGNGENLWTTHLWPNPTTGREGLRHTYAIRFFNIYLISGYYDDTPSALDPLDAAKAYVNEAIRRYREDPDAAIEYYQSTDSITDDDLSLYLTLLRGNGIVVNPVFPGARGTGITWRTDPLGREYGRALAEADEDGEVVEYLLPISSENFTFRKKTAWAIRADGLVFSAGWIDRETDVESTLTKRQKAVGTVIKVRARVQSIGMARTIEYYKTAESIDGEFYAILAVPGGNIVADATRPDLPVGTNITDLKASDDPELGQKMAAVDSVEGDWITHMWPNPVTGLEERRHTYVARFFAAYIISGYYEPEPCLQPIDGSGTFTGTWNNACLSESRPQDAADGGRAGEDYYARFYTFTLDAESDVTITLTSEKDNFLYLLDGHGTSGSQNAKNDDITSDNRNSRIEATGLAAGDYTIEATTYDAETSGAFTLSVEIDEVTTVPPPSEVKYKAISSGLRHACAITTAGSIDCRGDDSFGQVSKRPTSGNFTDISSGEDHTCALRDDGAWICWGNITVP